MSLLGNAISLSTTVTDISGSAADPATLTLTVTKPDSTTDVFNIGALTHGTTGVYSYTYTPSAVGNYHYKWAATVPTFAADGDFIVDTATSSVLSLAEVKRHLAIADTSYDDVLQKLAWSAQGVIEGLIGPITPRAYSETYDGGGYGIILRHVPVATVTSVVESWGTLAYTLTNQPVGASVDAFGYDIENPKSGRLVRRTVGGYPFPFFPGVGNVAVSYTAGRMDLPADIETAVIRQIRDLWTDYQSGRTSGRSAQPPMPYGVSNMVAELLRPHMLMPGIA